MGNYEDHVFYGKRWLIVFSLILLPLWFIVAHTFSSLDLWAVLRFMFFYLTGCFIWMGGVVMPDALDSPNSKPSQLARQVSSTIFMVLFSSIAVAICHYVFSMSPKEMLPYVFSAVMLAVAFNWLFAYYLAVKLTDHRGHMHSIGAGILYSAIIGAIFFISVYVADIELYLFVLMWLMAFLGYLTHLVCDEIFSSFKDESEDEKQEKFHQWTSWRLIWFDDDGKKKRSAGTALKWW